MTRRSRRSRRSPGLLEFALTSDWKLSAGMAGMCVLFASLIIPGFLGGKPVLVPLMTMFKSLAWLLAAVFGGISLLRYMKQRPDSSMVLDQPPVAPRRAEPSARMSPPLSPLDKALLAATLSPQCPSSSEVKPTVWSPKVIDMMEWKRFEDLCCKFYLVKGIRAETTRLGADGGVDIRLFQDESQPTRCTTVVQCKAWSQAVGVKPVRELRGVMAHEKVEKGFFMAPNGFTDDARTFAAENGITLLNGKLIFAMLERLPDAGRQALLAFATEGDWTTPTCPSCGVKMAARDSARGRFWGCIRYPKCRATLPMRAASAQSTS